MNTQFLYNVGIEAGFVNLQPVDSGVESVNDIEGTVAFSGGGGPRTVKIVADGDLRDRYGGPAWIGNEDTERTSLLRK